MLRSVLYVCALVLPVLAKSKPCEPLHPKKCPSSQQLGCILSGVYTEKEPESSTAPNYFEKLTFGDSVYTLLDNYYCAPDAVCPRSFAATLPTNGNYKVSNVACDKRKPRNINFQLTFTQRTNSLGKSDSNLTKRTFSGSMKSIKTIELNEKGRKSHTMIRS